MRKWKHSGYVKGRSSYSYAVFRNYSFYPRWNHLFFPLLYIYMHVCMGCLRELIGPDLKLAEVNGKFPIGFNGLWFKHRVRRLNITPELHRRRMSALKWSCHLEKRLKSYLFTGNWGLKRAQTLVSITWGGSDWASQEVISPHWGMVWALWGEEVYLEGKINHHDSFQPPSPTAIFRGSAWGPWTFLHYWGCSVEVTVAELVPADLHKVGVGRSMSVEAHFRGERWISLIWAFCPHLDVYGSKSCNIQVTVLCGPEKSARPGDHLPLPCKDQDLHVRIWLSV